MSKGIIKKCEKFLNSHDEKFQDPNFKHITFIVDILPHMKDGQVNRGFKIKISSVIFNLCYQLFDASALFSLIV